MPLSTSDILDAYRADLSNAGKSEFSDGDSTWLAFGTLLQRAVSLPAAERGAYLQSAAAALAGASASAPMAEAISALAADGTSAHALHAAVRILAAEAEDLGAFAIATAMLDFARILVGVGEFRLQGRLLAQQARILRKIGELDLARELFDEVGEIGATHGDQELVARAHLGKGSLARVRGNLPEAHAEFLAVLSIAESDATLRELRMHAHHGLLVAAALTRDFDTALKHGGLAMESASSEQQRLELLQNLSSACYDAGQFRSALNGFLQVLAACGVERVRIGSFGGAATAAARLGDARMVNALVAAASPLLSTSRHDFELADMSREFAEAYAYLGDAAQCDRYREEGLRRARRGKYFEVEHRLESMNTPKPKQPREEVALTRDALAVATHLASGDSTELLAAAVSSSRPELNSR